MDETFETAEEGSYIKRPGLLVILSGIGTSLGTLAALYVLEQIAPELNVMGWYANYIIPVGAMLVGFLAGSGYGLASWLTGAKIGKALMLQVLLLQVACYFLAQYVSFLMLNLPPGPTFWQYFDAATRSFAWNNHGQPGVPFGIWGYAIRTLEIAGFSLSGLFAPAILFSVPYCDACQVYMRTKDLGRLPVGCVVRKPRETDLVGQESSLNEEKTAFEAGKKLIEDLLLAVANRQPQAVAELLHHFAPRRKEIDAHTSRVVVSLHHCPACQRGTFLLKQHSGYGDQVVITDLSQSALDPEFVRSLMLRRDDLRT